MHLLRRSGVIGFDATHEARVGCVKNAFQNRQLAEEFRRHRKSFMSAFALGSFVLLSISEHCFHKTVGLRRRHELLQKHHQTETNIKLLRATQAANSGTRMTSIKPERERRARLGSSG